MIALAGTFNFGAPINRRADAITADGKTFRYSDVEFSDLARTAGNAPALTATSGAFIKVPAYADAIPRDGTAFGTPLSGIRAAGSELSDLDAFIVVDAANQNRYPARAGSDGSGGHARGSRQRGEPGLVWRRHHRHRQSGSRSNTSRKRPSMAVAPCTRPRRMRG